MATTTIKSTYSLDVETARLLDALARRLDVSKSEALRRAIRLAAAGEVREDRAALEALDELQASLALTPQAASRWQRQVREERRSAGDRREGARQ